jgi:hydroxymethylglutaryl-CoA lyase
MGKKVKIVEVGPRDGFQNICDYIPVEFKLEIIDGLVQAGLKHIECTSFVSPKAVPQMKDSLQVAKTVTEKYPDVEWIALIPNYHGAKDAVACGIKHVINVISLSKSHNQANIRQTHEQSFDALKKMLDDFPQLKIAVGIATAFGCCFEGVLSVQSLIDFAGKLRDLGVRDFNFSDSIGVAYPSQVKEALTKARAAFPDCEFSLHIHDTRNMGIICSYVGVLNGAVGVETALGGLGGCPFAPGATGNTSTEDFVYMMEREGYDTGIDFPKLLATAKKLHDKVPGNYSGHHIMISKVHPDFTK